MSEVSGGGPLSAGRIESAAARASATAAWAP